MPSRSLLVLALVCISSAATDDSQCVSSSYGVTNPNEAVAFTIPAAHFNMNTYDYNIDPSVCAPVKSQSQAVGVEVTVCPEEYSPTSALTLSIESPLVAHVSASSDTVVNAVVYCSSITVT